MSAHHAPALDAIAFQLVAALEQYEQDAGTMVATWLDMEQYGKVSDEVEQMRMLSAALPQLSVAWVEFLISHAELVHSLWRLRFQEREEDRGRLEAVRTRHAECLRSLRARCVRLLAQSHSR